MGRVSPGTEQMNGIMSLIRENLGLLIGYVFFAGIATLVDIGLLYLFTEYLSVTPDKFRI